LPTTITQVWGQVGFYGSSSIGMTKKNTGRLGDTAEERGGLRENGNPQRGDNLYIETSIMPAAAEATKDQQAPEGVIKSSRGRVRWVAG